MTQSTTPELALQQLQWRYATKQFDATKRIADDVWHVLEQSMVLAPSSFGLQPWKFFVVDNVEMRQELLMNSYKQPQVVDASHLVVFAVKHNLNAADVDRFIALTAEVQGAPVDKLLGYAGVIKGFLNNFSSPQDIDNWSARQVYLALGQFMTTAAMLGVDTSPLEGFVPPKYDEILGLTAQGYKSVVVCAAGYRSADDKAAQKPKVRYTTAELIQHIG
jgi:nitroreductase